MRTFILSLSLSIFSLLGAFTSYSEPIKIGVPLALTGDLAQSGEDQKNALMLVNEKIGYGKYELIFEDDKCQGKESVSIAQKLIHLDRVKYTLGFTCNQTLLITAPVYNKAGVIAISSGGTTGDVLDVGRSIFRAFPADNFCAERLYEYIQKRETNLGVLTEQTEYAIMMERTMSKANAAQGSPVKIQTFDFTHGTTDLMVLTQKLKQGGFNSVFLNADSDTSFITLLKRIREQKFPGSIYAAYLPASSSVQQALGSAVDGLIYCNLPSTDQIMTPQGKALMNEFKKRFGDPKSGFPVVPITLEAFRVLDLAIQSGKDPLAFLKTEKFTGGYIPDWSFDQHGAIQGLNFEMQSIEGGRIKRL